jgi:Fatty acid desaturase
MAGFQDTQTIDPARGGRRPGRGSAYAELSRQVRQAGLLDRRPAYYTAKIAGQALLFAAGWPAFLLLGDSWWQLASAAFLAFVFAQAGFLGHDAGHHQIFRTRKANDVVGLVHGNLLIGLSYGWWVGKHTRHHANPNHLDLDPDISIGAIAFTADQAQARRGLTCSSPSSCSKELTCTRPASKPCSAATGSGTGGWRGCCCWSTWPPTSGRCCWCCRR